MEREVKAMQADLAAIKLAAQQRYQLTAREVRTLGLDPKRIQSETGVGGPYEPVAGYRIAAIEDGGIAIEFIETALSDDEIWSRAEKQSVLHSEDPLMRSVATAAAKGRT